MAISVTYGDNHMIVLGSEWNNIKGMYFQWLYEDHHGPLSSIPTRNDDSKHSIAILSLPSGKPWENHGKMGKP